MGSEVVHRVVIQVSRSDPEGMNLALNNLMASKRYFEIRGEKLQAEIVTYGPGIAMLRADTSPVKDRIAVAQHEVAGLVLSMCGNAKASAEQAEGHPITPLHGVGVVPSGAVRVLELQESGWMYLRP